MTRRHVLYLHGFRSSPLSTKAVRVGEELRRRDKSIDFWCPQLPASPQEAMGLAMAGLRDWEGDEVVLIGSSLGGFYATVLAERLGCRALLLNPAVHPERDLAKMIGEQSSWQRPEDRFWFRAEFIEELRAMKPPLLTRSERYACVIAKGDEVLDWREMQARHTGALTLLLEGGDHALTDFAASLAFLLSFLSLSA
jgi:predicted esterase YcpF (UPF0227 family)